jgi:UDP-N-acetylmuramoyl-tripeptide--D-alanyl-D-alanine ligase
MQPVKLITLLERVKPEYVSDRRRLESLTVQSISTDTRSLKRGDLFVALPGERFDGHSFIGDALERGAAGVLFETGRREVVHSFLDAEQQALLIGVADSRNAFGKIAERYLSLFAPTKIVVTGSAGKTTTKGLAASVLSQRYRVVSSVRSFNNDVGVPKTILDVDEETEFLVQEIGTNHPGEIAVLSSIVHPDAALITNIGPAHIGYFGSERGIAREKKSALRALDRNGIAFLNADDAFFSYLKRGISARVLSFGIHRGDVRPDRITRIDVGGSEFELSGRKIVTKLLGEHGVLNAVAAACVGLHYGLSIDQIRNGIEAFRDESGRGNICTVSGVTLIDESYNANPLSVRASLGYLEGIRAEGKKYFVFGDMLELGDRAEHYHRELARDLAATGVTVLYTYGALARITGEELKKRGEREVRHFTDLGGLIATLRHELESGDVVLVKGSRKMGLERVVESFFPG